MKLISFTSETYLEYEEQLIMVALDSGIDYIHIRKPSWSELQMRDLISKISTAYYSRLVIHDHFELAVKLSLGGVHLNSRNSQAPKQYNGRISRSCHSIDELTEYSHLDYCTLSPIFDSISKVDYMSNFSKEELLEASERGIIGAKTIALGGISPKNIEQSYKFGFGGVAVLGYLWDKPTVKEVKIRVEKLKSKI